MKGWGRFIGRDMVGQIGGTVWQARKSGLGRSRGVDGVGRGEWMG